MELRDWAERTTAGEIMVTDVATVWPTHTLGQVAAVLLREQVSGVPVVEPDGPCVGVFSLVDVLRAEEQVVEERLKFAQSSFFTSELALPASVYADQLEKFQEKISPASEQPIQPFMTTNLVTVTEETSVGYTINMLVDAHIHRVLVIDGRGHLKGLVTAMDVLAALRRAVTGKARSIG